MCRVLIRPEFIMLLVILLGVITKLVVVSTDCNIGNINKTTDWTNFTGIWYWLYHVPHKYDENVDCPVSTFEVKTKNIGRITAYGYLKSTQTYDRFVGAVVDWNTNGYFDMIFPTPSSDTNCLADATCTKHSYYTRMSTGRFYAVSVDHGRYSILKFCCPTLDTPCIYVLFRTPNPDEGTLNDVKKALKEDGFDFNQLVKWETNHCQDIKSP